MKSYIKYLSIGILLMGINASILFMHAEDIFNFDDGIASVFEDPSKEEESFPGIGFEIDESKEVKSTPIIHHEVKEEENASHTHDETVNNKIIQMEKLVSSYEEPEAANHVVEESGEDYVEDLDDQLHEAVVKQWEKNVEKLLQQARVARKTLDILAAEGYYIKALNHKMRDDERIVILFEMADLYREHEMFAKESAVLEKFLDIYPNHRKAPNVNMRLGYLYREIGAPQTAIERFFHVLHMSLSVSPKEFEAFKKTVKRAQLEIAHTHFLMEEYENAIRHYKRLNLGNLSPEDQKIVLFRSGYAAFAINDYPGVLESLELFLQKFQNSDLAPEAHYLLASTYKALDRPEDTVREVRKLLKKEFKRMGSSAEIWAYWQKKTANAVANEFYEQGDYMNALKVYQAMVPVNKSADWQWPILYQIGLCFEQLGMYPKAHQAYTVIMNSTEWEIDLKHLSEALASIKEMAAWRQDHLKWVINSEYQLRKLLRPTTADIVAL